MSQDLQQSRLRRNLRLIMLHTALLNFSPIIPVIIPYYKTQIGLDFHQFMLGEALFSATIILMEVPTGWLSDVWTRKKVMRIGTLMHILGWLVVMLATGFWSAALGQMIIGVGISLLSGNNSAILYESLADLDRADEFRPYEGLRHGMGLYAFGASALFGGVFYVWHPMLPIVITWVTSVLALGVTFWLFDPAQQKSATHKHPLADMLATMRYAMTGNADVARIILFSAVLFAVTKMMMWAQQPYYAYIHLPLAWYGPYMAAGALLGGAGGHFSHKLDRFGDSRTVLKICALVGAIICVVCAAWPRAGTAALLMAGSAMFGVGFPRVQTVLSDCAPPDRRATILSTASLATHIFCVPLLAVSGLVSDAFGVRSDLLMLGALLLVNAGCAMLAKGQRENPEKAI